MIRGIIAAHRSAHRRILLVCLLSAAASLSVAQEMRRAPVLTEATQPAATQAPAPMSLEERVARLESQWLKSRAKEASLEQRLTTHTHPYSYTGVGLLREPINGHPVDLAIGPQRRNAQTSAAVFPEDDVPAPTVAAQAGLSLEERIARLEAEMLISRSRETALEQRLATHTHTYGYSDVGLLREPINGRPVDLAVNPRPKSAQTDVASP